MKLSRPLTSLLIACLLGCSQAAPVREQAAVRGKVAASPSRPPSAAKPIRDPFEFDSTFFRKKSAPQPGEWLAQHRERGQSVLAFERESTLRPTVERRTIVLQPLGGFSAERRAVLVTLERATALFFGLPVEIAEALPLPTHGRRFRQRSAGSSAQYLTSEILDLLARHAPEHAIAYLGVTFEDLYPEPSWNFVFGEARLSARVGVYSLVRFTPEFNYEAKSVAARQRFTRRAVQLLAHETGHIFGLEHCTAFECVMNGSNSLDESDRLPIEPCHECLHKLAFALHLHPLPRYLELARFYEEQGLSADAHWIRERSASLTPQ